MLRLTGGEFRGRAIKTPPSQSTRPTLSKMRQALFNSLQTVVGEARVLDLFSGSGALGFEALSRGAAHVVYIEKDRSVCRLIEQNAKELGVSARVTVFCEPVMAECRRAVERGPFDLVLADPPYKDGWELKLVGEFPWDRLLVPGGRLCIEWGRVQSGIETLPDQGHFLVKVREKNYGDSMLTTYEAVTHEQARA
jgi:16S rRNA (guanine966-N2)-methyltransferase